MIIVSIRGVRLVNLYDAQRIMFCELLYGLGVFFYRVVVYWYCIGIVVLYVHKLE